MSPTEAPAWLDRAAYPFSSHEVQVPQGRIHFVDEGAGPPLLFIHGTPSWSFEFRHLISGLKDRYRCVAPDLLGFGLSERPAAGTFAYTPEAHAAALAAFVEAVGLRDFTLVVHDFGGPIGLPLAIDTSKVKRLVVLNSFMWPLGDDPVMGKRARFAGTGFAKFLYRWLNLSLRVIAPSAWGDKKKLTSAIKAQYLGPFRSDPSARVTVLWTLAKALLGSSAHYQWLWDRRDAMQKLPALIVWGRKDSAFPPHLLERWTRALPQAEVVALNEAGHWPHEEEPHAVLEALSRFLQKTDVS